MTTKYTESNKYQEEIKQQYKQRVSKFTSNHVLNVLNLLKIQDLPNLDEIVEAKSGNVNATYITPKLVIKLNQKHEQADYLANKIVSDSLSDQFPVVKVIAYDNFEKTSFEVLVMERSKGIMLMDDIIEMSEKDKEIIFEQVLDVVCQLFKIKFKDFGWISFGDKKSFTSYSNFLTKEFNEHVSKIKAEQLCFLTDITKIEGYFKKHVSIFDKSESVFIHTDTHMGNILHEGNKLTALLDFDYSLKAPKVRALNSLLGFIDNPQQYVEGTENFEKFKGKNFRHLLKILKRKLPGVFDDPLLLRKLNIIGLKEGIMWVSQNWSADWNAEMIKGLIENEIPENDLSQTHHGKILADT